MFKCILRSSKQVVWDPLAGAQPDLGVSSGIQTSAAYGLPNTSHDKNQEASLPLPKDNLLCSMTCITNIAHCWQSLQLQIKDRLGM